MCPSSEYRAPEKSRGISLYTSSLHTPASRVSTAQPPNPPVKPFLQRCSLNWWTDWDEILSTLNLIKSFTNYGEQTLVETRVHPGREKRWVLYPVPHCVAISSHSSSFFLGLPTLPLCKMDPPPIIKMLEWKYTQTACPLKALCKQCFHRRVYLQIFYHFLGHFFFQNAKFESKEITDLEKK